jgi:hypothetical protein
MNKHFQSLKRITAIFLYNIYAVAKNMSIFIRLILLSLIFLTIVFILLNNQQMVDFVLIKDVIEIKSSLSILILLIALLTKLLYFIIKFIAKGIFLKIRK